MNQYKQFTRQYKGILTSSGIIALVIAGVVFGIVPAVKRIIEMRKETAAVIDTNTALRKKISILEGIDENVYMQYLKELSYAVPTDKAITSLFTTIDGLSNTTGVTQSDFTLTKPGSIATASAKRISNEERKLGSYFLPFTLTVNGPFESIHSFIEQSVLVRRFFRIRFFDINFATNSQLSAHMGMDAYYAPLPSNLGSASKALEPLNESDDKVITTVANMPLLGLDYVSAAEAQGGQVIIGPPRVDPFSLQ